MVKVIGYETRKNKSDEEFQVLVLQGNITPVMSKNGKMYFTASKCRVSCNFNAETCESIIGTEFSGEILKVQTEEYQYELPESGEIITLNHMWEYRDKTLEIIEENVIHEEEVL